MKSKRPLIDPFHPLLSVDRIAFDPKISAEVRALVSYPIQDALAGVAINPPNRLSIIGSLVLLLS